MSGEKMEVIIPKVNTDKTLEEIMNKLEELNNLISKAKSLADDLASCEIKISIEF